MATTISQAAPSSYYPEGDYYLDGAVESEWYGLGAQRLGLSGAVSLQDSNSLERGVSPDGKVFLVQNHGDPRRFRGNDQVDNPIGDVKLLFGLERDPAMRRALVRAMLDATKDKLCFEEEVLLFARRGHAGHRTEKALGSVWSLHFHATNRLGEPHPHVHARDYNLLLRQDGTWGAMNGIASRRSDKSAVLSRSTLYACKMELGEVFAQSLRLRLEALGYRTADATARMGHFRVLGVERERIEQFSTRAKDIRADMKARGVEGAKEASLSALLDRPRKTHVPLEELRKVWIEQAGGWDPATIRSEVKPQVVTYRVPDEIRARVEAKVQAQLQRADAHQSHQAKTARGVSQSLSIASTPLPERNAGERKPPEQRRRDKKRTNLAARVNRHLEHASRDGSHRLTRANVWAARRQVEIRGGLQFTDDERAKLVQITRGRGAVQFLAPDDSTRTASILTAARLAWKRSGFRVVLASPGKEWAKQLGEATGIHSMTVTGLIRGLTTNRGLLRAYDSAMGKSLTLAGGFPSSKSFLNYLLSAAGRWIRLNKKTVIVVDAPMRIELWEREELLRRARRAGAKVVLLAEQGSLTQARQLRNRVRVRAEQEPEQSA